MQRWVVAYDIPSDRRRLRVANVLEDFGDRIQESVFEVQTKEQELGVLTRRIARVILPAEDKVRLYPLCRDCAAKVIDLGVAERSAFDEPEVTIL
jgi:CRISPR-associated protein Cas2